MFLIASAARLGTISTTIRLTPASTVPSMIQTRIETLNMMTSLP
jgi:hypothetical protein